MPVNLKGDGPEKEDKAKSNERVWQDVNETSWGFRSYVGAIVCLSLESTLKLGDFSSD